MKYLFVGDIHNHSYMFKDIEDLDNEYHFDRIIFMGDYVDDWNTTNRESLNTLERVLNLKYCLNKVTLLWGNHESSYCGYPCGGHMYELDDLMRSKLEVNIDCFDLYTTVMCGDTEYVCTHAGLNNGYIEEVLGGKDNWKATLNKFNRDKLIHLDMLTPCTYMRGGNDSHSSFIWCDSREHILDGNDRIIKHQIVGHTPRMSIQNIDGLYFIDTHSTYSDGRPFGDKSYLIWNEDRFTTIYNKQNSIE